jgi:hypothetical protein
MLLLTSLKNKSVIRNKMETSPPRDQC